MKSKPKARYIPEKDKFRIGNSINGYEYVDYKEIKYKEHKPVSLGNGWYSEDESIEVENSFFVLMRNGYPIGTVSGNNKDINHDINSIII